MKGKLNTYLKLQVTRGMQAIDSPKKVKVINRPAVNASANAILVEVDRVKLTPIKWSEPRLGIRGSKSSRHVPSVRT